MFVRIGNEMVEVEVMYHVTDYGKVSFHSKNNEVCVALTIDEIMDAIRKILEEACYHPVL